MNITTTMETTTNTMNTKVPLNRKTSTLVYDEHGQTHVKYHQTRVISFNEHQITLRSGGWQTNTTKARINQASDDYQLGIGIHQVKGEWFVMLRNPKYVIHGIANENYWLDKEIPFIDGMTLIRTHFGRAVVPFLPIVGVPA